MELIDVVQRLKLVNDYSQCKKAMNDAITEIESLRNQLAESKRYIRHLEREHKEDINFICAQKSEIETLNNQLAECQKDAERYRYLKTDTVMQFDFCHTYGMNEVDAAIDQAMSEKG
jgi:DNA repair exonuclease SbcCD ATPase subunit